MAEFEVRATLPDRVDRQLIQSRVSTALELLRKASPMRYRYLLGDLPRILIGPTHSLGECHDGVGICLLQFDFVVADETTPERLALLLTHEGMHARLSRIGFVYETTEQRYRIEQVCATSELVVAARIPGGADAAASARRRLEWRDSEWSDAAMRGRRLHALRELGWEGWVGYQIARILVRFRRDRPHAASHSLKLTSDSMMLASLAVCYRRLQLSFRR